MSYRPIGYESPTTYCGDRPIKENVILGSLQYGVACLPLHMEVCNTFTDFCSPLWKGGQVQCAGGLKMPPFHRSNLDCLDEVKRSYFVNDRHGHFLGRFTSSSECEESFEDWKARIKHEQEVDYQIRLERERAYEARQRNRLIDDYYSED